MKYYRITKELAEYLCLTSFRHQTKDGGYLANASDLVAIDIDNFTSSIVEVSPEEAKTIIL